MSNSTSVNTTITNVTNNINQSLVQNASASATANCNVKIGNLSFTKNTGCSVTVSNLCSASATAALSAVVEAAYKTFTELSVSNQQATAQLFSNMTQIATTSSDIKNNFSNYVEQTCNANATLNQNISIQNIELGECTPNFPIEFKFTNTGNASANCAIGIIQKLIAGAGNELAVANEQTNSYGLIVIALLGLAGIFAFMVYLWLGKRVLFPTNEEKIRLALARKAELPWTFLWEMLRGRS